MSVLNIEDINIEDGNGISLFPADDNFTFSTRYSALGDFNGDGFDDIFIISLNGNPSVGLGFILLGTNENNFNAFGQFVINDTRPPSFSEAFGLENDVVGPFTGRGDFNGDGLNDLIIGDRTLDLSPPDIGAGGALLLFGNQLPENNFDLFNLDGASGRAFIGFNSQDFIDAARDQANFGFSTSIIGDFNGDGIDDIAIAGGDRRTETTENALGNTRRDVETGIDIRIIYGSREETDFQFPLETVDNNNGTIIRLLEDGLSQLAGISPAGDVNGDGLDDLVVSGARRNTEDSFGNPISFNENFLIFGQEGNSQETIELSDLDGSRGIRIFGERFDFQSLAINSVGDFNGDGTSDLAIFQENDLFEPSTVFVLYGNSNLSSINFPERQFTAEEGFFITSPNQFIESIDDVGDVNGDGFDDIVVELSGFTNDTDEETTIRAAVIFGGPNGFENGFDLSEINGENGFFINSVEASIGSVEINVGPAGDVNGDGFDDIAYGQDFFINNARVDGFFTIIFGGASIGNDSQPTGLELNGDNSDNRLIGRDGNDTLSGGPGNDNLNGGAGDDVLDGGEGNDFISGRQGQDIAFGNTGNDQIFAGGTGSGNDTFSGGAGDDTVGGGDGDDLIIGDETDIVNTPSSSETGSDILFGGAGNDTIITGSFFDSNGNGTAEANEVTSNAGDIDIAFSGSGNDLVLAGLGNDILGGGLGDDTIIAGAGDDVLFGGRDTNGPQINDVLDGGSGNDEIFGSGGNDSINGSSGLDTIFGGGGDDTIAGGSGDDTIFGGGGDDFITTGEDADVLFFANDHGADTITDFDTIEDILVLINTLTSFQSLADVLAASEQTVEGLLIDTGGNSILLQNIESSDLSEDNFIFS